MFVVVAILEYYIVYINILYNETLLFYVQNIN